VGLIDGFNSVNHRTDIKLGVRDEKTNIIFSDGIFNDLIDTRLRYQL
jgi:hypothetical protein